MYVLMVLLPRVAVSMVIGCTPYQPLCDEFEKPFVVTGFEPLDLLQAILMVVKTA